MEYTLPHTFFENSIKGFIGYLSSIFKPYKENILNNSSFPIQIINTGDEVYINDYMENTKYNNVPRIDIRVASISKDNEQTTAHKNMGNVTLPSQYDFKEKLKVPVRRFSTNIIFDIEVKFSNIFEYMSFVDYLMTINHSSFDFEIYYLGCVYPCNIEFTSEYENQTNYSLEYSNQSRDIKMNLGVDYSVQFPSFDIYSISKNTGGEGNSEAPINSGGTMYKLVNNLFESFKQNPNEKIKLNTNEITENKIE